MTTSGEEPQVPLAPPSPYTPPVPPAAQPPAAEAAEPPMDYLNPPAPPQPQAQQPYPPQQYGQPSYPAPQYGQPPYGQQQYPPPPYGQQYPPGAYAQNPYAQPFGYGIPAPSGPVSGATRMLGWAILALGALVVLGAFLPWLTAGEYSVSGIGGGDAGTKDGVITLPLGLIAAGLGLARALTSKRSAIHLVAAIISLIAGVLIALIAVVDMADIKNIGFGLSVGFGLLLTLIAGGALGVVSIVAIVKRT